VITQKPLKDDTHST